MFKEQCTATLTGNKLSMRGVNTNEWQDILSCFLLLLPKKTKAGHLALGVYIQAEVIYNRYKAELHELKEIIISGHSLGAGISLHIAVLLFLNGYVGKIHIHGIGGVKCISEDVAMYLYPRLESIEWHARYRDPIPVIGQWKEPEHKTPRSGDPKKWVFDYSMKEHVMY